MMNEEADGTLLRSYAKNGSEDTFEKLVRRHINFVYSIALRQAGQSLAEDVVQMVFLTMAQKAEELSQQTHLAGWLHTTTRFISAKVVRSEVRRNARERESIMINCGNTPPVLENIAGNLDEALGALNEKDRTAILLRFFNGLSHLELAKALGISDDAAQKRVSRALDKLHALLVQRNPSLTPTTLATLITAHGIQTSPAALVTSVTGLCAAWTPAIATTPTMTFGTLMTIKTKLLCASAIFIAGVAVPTLLWKQSESRLKSENQRLSAELAQSQTKAGKDSDEFKRAVAEAELYKAQAEEVHKLRAEIASLRSQQKVAVTPQPATETTQQAASPPQTLEEMADYIGKLRANAFGKNPLTAEEAEWLANTRAHLEKLEQNPADFALLQTSFIRNAIGLTDPEKEQKIQKIIQDTYEQAVAQKLDVPSRPVSDDKDWVQRRHQLDRLGTAQVQALLTPEERKAFNRVFLGIMGVDLGRGVVDTSLYPDGFLGPPKSSKVTQ